MSITRKLLGMEPRKRIAAEIYRKLGLLGSLTTYRVAEKIGRMFGWGVDKLLPNIDATTGHLSPASNLNFFV